MTRIQLAVFPAILLGILVTILFASLAHTSETVQAYTDPTQTSTLFPTTAPIAATAGAPTAANTQTAAPSSLAINTQPAASAQLSDCSVSGRYPVAIRQWCAMIEKYASPANMEPNLIAAIMLQESGGNPKAYSPSGAVGLMQIMPRDGLAASFRCGGSACFASRPTIVELYDPDYNISYGVRMIAALIQKTGTVRDALRSYGPMDVGYYYADKVLKIYQAYQ